MEGAIFMTKNIKIFSAVFLLIGLLTGLTGCGSSAKTATEAPQNLKIRYIVNNLGTISPIDLALEKGFFKEQGVNVETVGLAGGGAPAISAVLSDSADISGAAMPAYINAVKAGSKLKVIYGGAAVAHAKDPGVYWIVREDSNIKSAQDLVGKTIAMGARGAIWEYGTKEYLKKAGLSIDQATIILVPPPQQEQVLRTGQVDVVVLQSPFADQLLSSGGVRILTTLIDVLGEVNAGAGYGSIMRQDFIDKNPELVKKVTTALVKADEWAQANPEEARKVVGEILKKREQNPIVATYWRAPSLRNHGQLVDEDVNFWLDWFVKDGKLKQGEIKAADIYTNEFNPYYKK
jgi:ABC-type nitrate/sulfonate/bicarbonate transport system substrate-binding protein